jgi:hypothetical protein
MCTLAVIGKQLSKYSINSKEKLKENILEVCNNIEKNIIENLVNNMQRCINL